jgi:hypothetical protein
MLIRRVTEQEVFSAQAIPGYLVEYDHLWAGYIVVPYTVPGGRLVAWCLRQRLGIVRLVWAAHWAVSRALCRATGITHCSWGPVTVTGWRELAMHVVLKLTGRRGVDDDGLPAPMDAPTLSRAEVDAIFLPLIARLETTTEEITP